MLHIDGKAVEASLGTVVPVKESFIVEPVAGYRVNVIGWRQDGRRDESGVPVLGRDLIRRFSIDRDGRMYRVEFYRGPRFAGMLLVNIGPAEELAATPPAGNGALDG